jgi:hypothetical protein
LLWLVEITHPDLDDPLRLTSNVEPINSRGRLFYPARMAISLPEQVEDRPARATLVLEDVTHEIRLELIALPPTRAPRVTSEIVLGSDPDVTQRAMKNARVSTLSMGLVAIEAELAGSAALSRAVPWLAFTPDVAPAVFRFAGR